MTRMPVYILAALAAAAPLSAAAEREDERPRISMGAAVQRASAGRPGRFLGASNRGDTIVVRWEYPGGRVADIMVDGRTGRVIGER